MTIDALRGPTPITPTPCPANHESTDIEDAARQFESLLLASILKSMREAESAGWLSGGEDQTSAAAIELAEEQFAQALAAQGGLGLTTLVTSGLNRTR